MAEPGAFVVPLRAWAGPEGRACLSRDRGALIRPTSTGPAHTRPGSNETARRPQRLLSVSFATPPNPGSHFPSLRLALRGWRPGPPAPTYSATLTAFLGLLGTAGDPGLALPPGLSHHSPPPLHLGLCLLSALPATVVSPGGLISGETIFLGVCMLRGHVSDSFSFSAPSSRVSSSC